MVMVGFDPVTTYRENYSITSGFSLDMYEDLMKLFTTYLPTYFLSKKAINKVCFLSEQISNIPTLSKLVRKYFNKEWLASHNGHGRHY